jgi:hypothetical protein
LLAESRFNSYVPGETGGIEIRSCTCCRFRILALPFWVGGENRAAFPIDGFTTVEGLASREFPIRRKLDT